MKVIPEKVARYIGTQEGFGGYPAIRLYNLLVKLGPHNVGSTLSEKTILKYLNK